MKGEIVGVFEILNIFSSNGFDKIQIEFGKAVSNQISISLNNAKLFASEQQAKNKNEALIEILKVNATAKGARDAIDKIGSASCRVIYMSIEDNNYALMYTSRY